VSVWYAWEDTREPTDKFWLSILPIHYHESARTRPAWAIVSTARRRQRQGYGDIASVVEAAKWIGDVVGSGNKVLPTDALFCGLRERRRRKADAREGCYAQCCAADRKADEPFHVSSLRLGFLVSPGDRSVTWQMPV
jgi:hypothetical protein